jgi:tRNA threonylcarbamoyl adenosine modification protein YeaZ
LPPDPLILAFDTSAAHCAAALLSGDRLLAEAFEAMDKGQAERLVPLLAGMLAQAGVNWPDLAALAVGTGPGNFTGVRIAVAAARGLALGLGIPAIGVTRFAALALGQPVPLTVIEDARRGEVYLARTGDQPHLARLENAVALGGPYVGSAAHLTPGPVIAPRWPLAEAIARVGLLRLGQDNPRPAPFYLRSADALPPADPPPLILP